MKVICIYANQSTIDKRMAERVKRGQSNQSEYERRQIKDHNDFKVAGCLADKIVYNNYNYDLDEVIKRVLGYYIESVSYTHLVRDSQDNKWFRRHFANFKDGVVYAWDDGQTSWSSLGIGKVDWKYAKLAEDEE